MLLVSKTCLDLSDLVLKDSSQQVFVLFHLKKSPKLLQAVRKLLLLLFMIRLCLFPICVKTRGLQVWEVRGHVNVISQ